MNEQKKTTTSTSHEEFAAKKEKNKQYWAMLIGREKFMTIWCASLRICTKNRIENTFYWLSSWKIGTEKSTFSAYYGLFWFVLSLCFVNLTDKFKLLLFQRFQWNLCFPYFATMQLFLLLATFLWKHVLLLEWTWSDYCPPTNISF